VVGALHTVNDLERIGDEAKKIALRLRESIPHAGRWEAELARVCRMAEAVRVMLNQALDASVRGDPAVSALLQDTDEEVDASRDALNASVVVRMALEPGLVSQGLALIFMVQSLERIGDHAKNIAEHVVTVVDGVDRRHATGEGVRSD
jgi:phosphate transport system protein